MIKRISLLIGFVAIFALCLLLGVVWAAQPATPFNAIDLQGRPMVGASVTVVDALTGVPSVVYQDRAASTLFSGKVSPQGLVQFFANPGKYRVTISSGGLTRIYETDIADATDALMLSDFGSDTPGLMTKLTSSTIGLVKYNITTSIPGVGDDEGDGYSPLSTWIDTSSDSIYVCTDSTAGAAVWKNITSGGVISGLQNVGGANEVFKQINPITTRAEFRTLRAGTGVTLTQGGSDITIANSGSSNVADATVVGSIPVWTGAIYNPYPFAGFGTNCGLGGPFFFGTPEAAANCSTAALQVIGNQDTGPYPGVMASSTDSDIQPGDVLGTYAFGGLDSSTTPRLSAYIRAKATGVAWSSNINTSPTVIQFSVQGSTGSDLLGNPLMQIRGSDRKVFISTDNSIVVDNGGTNRLITQGLEIRRDNGFGIGIKVPTGLGSTTNLTLPPDAGSSGNWLLTDGAGVLSWSSVIPTHASTHNIGGGDELSFYGLVDNEGTPLTARRAVNFIGAGVNCVDNSGASRTDCTITGSGSGTGITELNGLTADPQLFAVGTSGTDFAIVSASDTHTFNLPNASATARGVVSTSSQTIAGAKTFNAQTLFPAGLTVNAGGTSGTSMVNASTDNITNAFRINATNDTVAINSTGPFDGTSYNAYFLAESTSTRNAAMFTSTQSSAVKAEALGTGKAFEAFAVGSGTGYYANVTFGPGLDISRTDGTDAVTPVASLTRDNADGNAVLALHQGASGADVVTMNNGSFDTMLFGADGTMKVKPTLTTGSTNPRYSFIGQTDEGMDVNTSGELVLVHAAIQMLTLGDSLATFFNPVSGGTATSAAGFTSTASSTGHAFVGTNSSSGDVFHGTAGTGNGIYGTSNSTGRAALFERSSATATEPVVKIENLNSSSTVPALTVKTNNTGATAIAFNVLEGSDSLFKVENDGDGRLLGFLKVDTLTGTGKIVCVKSDGNLGVCNATTIGTSTCTCA